ncbi:PqiB family protein [Pseudoduganella albidiflava]|uniref:MCE family protein n=1 Tax=Pseudoduganella albidiflava TaxID=321983 RepID=A0A411WX35_9BURK|nr:MlaD family protein [Pseudoduganella albidiflava]QBI01305.1 MCE family protein [Pseudoduganella albidiflava]GGY36715.1 paraquat-inducible protein B [Pseudoduganella albidiflava]
MPEQDLPPPAVDRPSRWLPSLIWLIPVLAAVIGATQVVNWMTSRGPTITVSFATGEGLEAGKTKVKYKDVDIGEVVAVTLGEDANRVDAKIQMAREARRFTAEDTRFWVVRPQIGASGVSGLGTLLSGPYIGAAPGSRETTTSVFKGLDTPPAVPPGLKGREYRLHADSLGSVGIGSPVYYRRLRVGQVAAFELDREGDGIDMSVFVEDRYVGFVGTDTRWWHASGVDLRLDAAGFKLNTQSLAALATGGIAFESGNGRKPAAAAPAGTRFILAEDRAAALRAPDGPAVAAVLYFDQSLRGLVPGAPVDFRGIVLGEVRAVGVEFDRVRRVFRMPVTIDLYPGRLGKRFLDAYSGDVQAGHDTMARMIGRGLRGQLRTGSLLTNQLYIALDFFPNAPKAALVVEPDRLVLPTVPGSLDELQSQLLSIARKLDKVPFDEIGANLNRTLAQANTTLEKLGTTIERVDGEVLPEVTETLASARKTFASAESLLAQDAPLQSDLRRTLQEVTRTMESIDALAEYLERHPESLIRGKPQEKKK